MSALIRGLVSRVRRLLNAEPSLDDFIPEILGELGKVNDQLGDILALLNRPVTIGPQGIRARTGGAPAASPGPDLGGAA